MGKEDTPVCSHCAVHKKTLQNKHVFVLCLLKDVLQLQYSSVSSSVLEKGLSSGHCKQCTHGRVSCLFGRESVEVVSVWMDQNRCLYG